MLVLGADVLSFRKWIEMKHDHILEKVRNSFRDAAKKVPPKMQQRMMSKNSVSPISKKSLATGVHIKPRQHSETIAGYRNDATGESDEQFPTSTKTEPTLKRNRSVNSCGEFNDFTSSLLRLRAKSDDDNYSVRSTPEIMQSGKPTDIFRARSEYHHSLSSTGRSNLSQMDIARIPYAQHPNLLDQNENVDKKSDSTDVATKSMEVERLEDLLFAVDSALHWKASSSTSTDASIGSISNDNLKSASLMLDATDLDDSKPPFVPKETETTEKVGGPSRKSYGNDSDESNDSTFVLMMEQALGPLQDTDANEQRNRKKE
jgi:hypothetical protein